VAWSTVPWIDADDVGQGHHIRLVAQPRQQLRHLDVDALFMHLPSITIGSVASCMRTSAACVPVPSSSSLRGSPKMSSSLKVPGSTSPWLSAIVQSLT
jgi:hypothetical protein